MTTFHKTLRQLTLKIDVEYHRIASDFSVKSFFVSWDVLMLSLLCLAKVRSDRAHSFEQEEVHTKKVTTIAICLCYKLASVQLIRLGSQFK